MATGKETTGVVIGKREEENYSIAVSKRHELDKVDYVSGRGKNWTKKNVG